MSLGSKEIDVIMLSLTFLTFVEDGRARMIDTLFLWI